MLKIISVKWISKIALEAEVKITDGVFEINCFSQPCRYLEGDIISENLYGFNAKNVKISNESIVGFKKIGDNFEYEIVGKLVNKLNKVISVGEILIEIEDIPYDINEGDYIEVKCMRIDIY